jgi:hypothetical protein
MKTLGRKWVSRRMCGLAVKLLGACAVEGAHDLMPGLSALAADVFDLCALVCWNDVPPRMEDVELPTEPRSEWRQQESVMAARPAESVNGCLLW